MKDYESLSRRAEALVVRALRRKPRLLLGVATGASPAGLYERLAGRAEPALSAADHGRARRMAGPARGHRGSCERYIQERILGPLGVPRRRYQGFRAGTPNRPAEVRRLSRWLDREGPLDLAILGLGRNGHLLMNEPAGALQPRAHVARLAESTRPHTMIQGLRDAAAAGADPGLAEILRSRAILLLVSGRAKRAALKRALEGPVTTRCPASFLWLHPDGHDRL